MIGHQKILKTEIFFFIKNEIIFLKIQNYDLFMIMKPLDILENCKLIMQYLNTTGGQDFELLYETTFKDVESVNSLK